MLEMIRDHEPVLRLACFAGTAGLIGLWQTVTPRRPLRAGKLARWASNFGIAARNTLILRLLFPVLAVGLAAFATERGWGLLNMLDVSLLPAVIIALILQDLVIYGQHVMFHHVPLFWRFHRMHH